MSEPSPPPSVAPFLPRLLSFARQVFQTDDCLSRTLYGTTVSAGIGAFLGALRSNWQDLSTEASAQLSRALQKTGGAMLKYGVFLGGVGLLYCSTDCFVEKLRDKSDFVNGVCGGLAAGLAVGMKTRSASVGVGSGFAMGAMSALVDATGHSLGGEDLIPHEPSVPRRKTHSPTVRVD